jgi:hypothetical protein
MQYVLLMLLTIINIFTYRHTALFILLAYVCFTAHCATLLGAMTLIRSIKFGAQFGLYFMQLTKRMFCNILLICVCILKFVSLYSRLTLYVQHILAHAHESIRAALRHRLVSLSGNPNRHMGPDMVTEKQNLMGRYLFQCLSL